MIVTEYSDEYGVIEGLRKTYAKGTFWVYIAQIVGIWLFFNHIYYMIKRNIFPNMKDKIRSIKTPLSEEEYERYLHSLRDKELGKSF